MMELEFDIRGLMKLVCLAFYEAQARARGSGCNSSFINMMFLWLVSFFVLQGRFGLLPVFYLLLFSFIYLRLPLNHKLRFFFSNL
jgi:hypothetical protein